MHEFELTPESSVATVAASMASVADLGHNKVEVEPHMCCGIDLNKYSGAVSEEDAQEYHDNIYALTKIELIRGMRKLVALEKDLYMIRGLMNMATSNEAMIKSFVGSVGNLVDHIKEDEDTDKKPEEQTEPEDEPLDYEATSKQLDTYEHQLDAMLDIMHIRYEEIKTSGNTTIAEDITETLIKNKSTLENVDNLNANKYMEYIDVVIEELKGHSIKRILNKVTVPKRTSAILKDFTRDVERSFKEILNCGFSPSWIFTIADFMWEEQSFACDNKEVISKNGFASLSLIFMYHVSQIVNSEVKKHNYLSLIFKYYVLQILEIQNTTKMEEDQRFDENDEENEVSKIRSNMYKEYRQLFDAYAEAEKVSHGVIKNNAEKIKSVMSQIMNPPRHRRKEPEVEVENTTTEATE